jgi:ABC-2 type transport system ATP-binding protein
VFRPGRKGEVKALDRVTFDVSPHEIVGVLGPNGAGKSTTIKSICTLVRPTAGSIVLDGIDVLARPRAAVAHVAAVLEGNRNVYWRLSVRENIEFFAALHGNSSRSIRSYLDQLIEQFGLRDKRDAPARMLSRGMQQKLAVACALARQTPVVLLDEPTLGLDVETSLELRQYLRELGTTERTIVVTSHDMDVVQEVCDRVVIINHGRVVADDKVANLLALFKAQAYRVQVAGSLSPEQQAALRARFSLIEISAADGSATIDVELPGGSGLYDLMDVLRSGNSVIEGIDRADPDLEQIFLQILKGAS